MNVVAISGRLVRDPELRHTAGGTSVANFTIAVDRAGQKEGDEFLAGFFDVTVWKERGEWVAQYLNKGSRVEVTGELRHRKWETQEGQKRSTVEINAFRVDFGETRAERTEREGGQGSLGGGGSQPAAVPAGDFTSSTDDDIPFVWMDNMEATGMGRFPRAGRAPEKLHLW